MDWRAEENLVASKCFYNHSCGLVSRLRRYVKELQVSNQSSLSKI